MELMKLSDVCKKFCFTRRVIQGYEKEGLIKHSGRNKYGHLMYDKDSIKKIAYIRYLQINGFSLKEISNYKNVPSSFLILLEDSNKKHKLESKKRKRLIEKNKEIIEILSNSKLKSKEDIILDIITREINTTKI